MKFGKILMTALVLAIAAISAPQACADDDAWIYKPAEKLGRGVANAAFGVLELPMSWVDVTNSKGGIAGLTFGTFRGLVRVVERELVGVVEIATFLIPLPNCPEQENGFGYGYGPIMRPEWVVDVSHDWQNFVYDRSSMAESEF